MNRELAVGTTGVVLATSILLHGIVAPRPASIASVYRRAAPSVALIKSIGSTRDPVDVVGSRIPDLRGAGTGFVVMSGGGAGESQKSTKKKYSILTSYHIVADSEEVIVRLGASSMPARIEHADVLNDVAILEYPFPFDIDVDGGLLPLCAADPDANDVGAEVLLIGHPFGLDKSVSSGIVSGIDRDNGIQRGLIQTDAAMNPGNSGGPMILTSESCIAGMSTSIVSPSGSSAGVNFAIPGSTLREALDERQ